MKTQKIENVDRNYRAFVCGACRLGGRDGKEMKKLRKRKEML